MTNNESILVRVAEAVKPYAHTVYVDFENNKLHATNRNKQGYNTQTIASIANMNHLYYKVINHIDHDSIFIFG